MKKNAVNALHRGIRMPQATSTTTLSDDQRWRLVEATARQHGNRPDALIETLHTLQDAFGYIDRQALRRVARLLDVPPSQAYGVATFYHLFTLQPPARHACVVCCGTACHIKGALALAAAAREALGLGAADTAPVGGVSISSVRCVGTCGIAPLVVLDGEVLGNTNAEEVRRRLRCWSSDVS
jgi:bidirectional [NiFe] hydrogenase diaphorase subunit